MDTEKKRELHLWTSYFARVKKLPEGFKPVSIALYGSRWVKVPDRIQKFAPTKDMLTADDWREQYEALVRSIIERGEMEPILDALDPNTVLLCHAKDPNECHRTILANILREEFAVRIEEWTPGN